MNKVFLGGTCNGSTWRDEITPILQIEVFNPVVDDWDESCQKVEIVEKELHCNIHLYVITSDMTGVFSIAEAIESAHNPRKITIFHVLPDGFSKAQLKSLEAVIDMVLRLGGIAYIDLDLRRSARVINHCFK